MKIYKLIYIAIFFSLTACGGSGSSPVQQANNLQLNNIPLISQPLIPLAQGISFGLPYWKNEPTPIGGDGFSPVGNVKCSNSEQYHIHAHLTILLDGKPLAIPAKIGLNGCDYELHTHDQSGIIHVEAAAEHLLTLGDFFSVWGQPLLDDNIANITGKQISVFTVQDGIVKNIRSGIREIPIKPHLEIVICIGNVPESLPSFIWDPLL